MTKFRSDPPMVVTLDAGDASEISTRRTGGGSAQGTHLPYFPFSSSLLIREKEASPASPASQTPVVVGSNVVTLLLGKRHRRHVLPVRAASAGLRSSGQLGSAYAHAVHPVPKKGGLVGPRTLALSLPTQVPPARIIAGTMLTHSPVSLGFVASAHKLFQLQHTGGRR